MQFDWLIEQIASEAIDKIRTIAALTKEPYFLDSYMSHFNDMKKLVLYVWITTWVLTCFRFRPESFYLDFMLILFC